MFEEGFFMTNNFRLYDFLSPERIIDIQSDSKDDALKELVEVIATSKKVSSRKIFEKKVFERERLMSTGIGYGIAVPHIRDDSISNFVIAIGRKTAGIKYDSIDNKPVKLIFMIGASHKQDKEYVRVLSRLVLRLKNKEFIKQLLKIKHPQDIYNLIKEHE